MQGIIVEIPDHPITGHKRKVEIVGLGINFNNEVVGLETVCRYYENIDGEYGPEVSIPVPIKIEKTLVAVTSGPRVVYVHKETGEAVIKRTREIEVLIPEEEREEGGPETRMETEEYWVLEKVEPEEEVPAEMVIELFYHLNDIINQSPVVVAQLMAKFVQDEVWYGTYDKA